MQKWLSRTLLVLLILIVLGGALYGAFYAGKQIGTSDASEFSPRLDRDQVKPSLRDDDAFVMPMFHRTDGVFSFTRFPMLGFLVAAIWMLVRLGLLILLVWLIVKFVLNKEKSPTVLPPPPDQPSE